ncbi:MAG: CsbD family protein [Saprospiraceae bacterium]|nr:CsbD family protein [Saprospiraceae bacterium]
MQVEGNWHVLRGALRKKYGQLTDDDLMMSKGEGEKTLGRLEKKLGKTREELMKEFKSILN